MQTGLCEHIWISKVQGMNYAIIIQYMPYYVMQVVINHIDWLFYVMYEICYLKL